MRLFFVNLDVLVLHFASVLEDVLQLMMVIRICLQKGWKHVFIIPAKT